jgi:hypothetical protein
MELPFLRADVAAKGKEALEALTLGAWNSAACTRASFSSIITRRTACG